MTRRRTDKILLAMVLLFSLAPGQIQPAVLSPEARISHLVILPGDQLYTLWGHCAIRVMDPSQSIDQVYNYGTFNFEDPRFLLQFLQGTLNYFLSRERFGQSLWYYTREEKRTVIEQKLNLSADQQKAVYEYLVKNLQPENRYYQYDFLYDNCATRIRDLLETVLGPYLQYPGCPLRKESFRRQISRYLTTRPDLDFSFALLLGPSADRMVTTRESMFLPPDLMAVFTKSKINDADGRIRPLVSGTRTIPSSRAAREGTGRGWAGLGVWAILLAGSVLTVPDFLFRRPKWVIQRWTLLKILDFLLFFSLGIVGCLILYLWIFSTHTVADGNLNLFFAFPLHLPMAVRFLFARKGAADLKIYCLFSLFLVTGGLIVRLFIPQYIHPLFIPLFLLIGIRCWHRVRPGITSDPSGKLPG